MGSGKTAVGRRLAAALARPFRDSDKDIQTATGFTVRELGERDGIEAMHALEAEHVMDTLRDPEPSVIGAAASTIEVPAVRERMRKPDVAVVWLRATPETLAQRFVSKDQHRPEFGASPRAFLAEQAKRRDPLFESVRPIAIDVDRVRPREVAVRALDALGSIGRQ